MGCVNMHSASWSFKLHLKTEYQVFTCELKMADQAYVGCS